MPTRKGPDEGKAEPRRDEPQPRASSAGWLERLEAARKSTPGLPLDRPPPLPEPESNDPPPLPEKPVHRLVSQLSTVRAPSQSGRSFTTRDLDDLGSIDVPALPERGGSKLLWLRSALLVAGIVIVGAASVVTALRWANEADITPEVDPALKLKLERAATAAAELEAGHEAVGRKPKVAVEHYRKALLAEPSLPEAEKGLGIAFVKMNQPSKAVRHYKRYLELDPAAKDAAKVRRFLRDYEARRR